MKGARGLSPNDMTHPQFGKTLRRAAESGVHILAFDSLVSPDSLVIDQAVPVLL